MDMDGSPAGTACDAVPAPDPRTVVIRQALDSLAEAQNSVGRSSELAAILGRVALAVGAVDSGGEWEQW